MKRGYLLTSLLMVAGFLTEEICGAHAADIPEVNDAGLVRVPLEDSGETVQLPIKLVVEPRCFFGDRDAIGLELIRSATPDTELLLTVEPLPNATDTQAAAITSITAAAKHLDGGYDVTLSLPGRPNKAILGLYICKDSRKEGRCRGKEVQSLPKVLQQYDSLQGSLTPEFVASDKIYFFKPLFIEAGALQYPSLAMSAARYAQLEQFINRQYGLSKESKNAVEQILKLGDTLQSRPLQMNDGKLVIRLPGYTPKRCRGA